MREVTLSKVIPGLRHTAASPKLIKSSDAGRKQELQDLAASLDEAFGAPLKPVPFALTGVLDETKLSRGAALGLDESETTALVRYTSLDYGEINAHLRGISPKPGEVLERKAPVSTSLNESLGGDLNYDYSEMQAHVAYLAIDSVGGRDVSALSSYEGEQEVLFPAGQKFEIVSRTDVPKATFFVFRDLADSNI